MGRRSYLAIPAVVAGLLAAACGSPMAPNPPDPSMVKVSGRVLAYSGPSEFAAIGGPRLFGWVDAGGQGRPTGQIPLDTGGRFTLVVERGARVRLYAGGHPGDEMFQPCAVTVDASADVTRDVRMVDDYDVIGAAIPPEFREHTRILSGQVYEVVDGRREPVPFSTVSVGGFRDFSTDIGWPIANTRTDADGRYVICGLEMESSATVYVVNPLHEMFEVFVEFSGDMELDVELTRATATRTKRRP
jgi:hypothetical protein